MAFKGRVVYSRTVSEVENAAKELLKFVETRMGGTDQVVLGFDIEWKPSFIRGFCRALLSLSCFRLCFLFNICKFRSYA